jgi:TolB-like protein
MTTEPRATATTRKLAAIVVADVAGYSRMMERDEAATHERLRTIFRDVAFPGSARHGGRVVKTTGDGVLVEFASATAALRFAIEMQRDMAVRNASVAAAERIEFGMDVAPSLPASGPPPAPVLVLPFTTQDADRQVAALARALAPMVARTLANSMRDAHIVDAASDASRDARSSAVRYRLTADVRASGDDVVVAASLVDALSDKQVASEQRGMPRAGVEKERDLLVARVAAASRPTRGARRWIPRASPSRSCAAPIRALG